MPRAEHGFTLIEAMVALSILGIAAVGIIRAAEAHVDTLSRLEQRAAAQWVAENALAEVRLGPGAADHGKTETMLGTAWDVRTERAFSADPDLRLVTVRVARQGSDAPLVRLQGFADAGTVTPR